MNALLTTEFIREMIGELRAYLALCEKILALAAEENRALSGAADFEPATFQQQRKKLLPDLELFLARLKKRRIVWQQASAAERERHEEVKSFIQTVQNLLMKILLLDRENQQAMLRRGLVPANHLPAAAVQPPNYVASVYQRHFKPSAG